jgi:hypothetical protein
MQVCPRRHPVMVQTAPEQEATCWLHGPAELIPPGQTAPLEREELSLADEA